MGSSSGKRTKDRLSLEAKLALVCETVIDRLHKGENAWKHDESTHRSHQVEMVRKNAQIWSEWQAKKIEQKQAKKVAAKAKKEAARKAAGTKSSRPRKLSSKAEQKAAGTAKKEAAPKSAGHKNSKARKVSSKAEQKASKEVNLGGTESPKPKASKEVNLGENKLGQALPNLGNTCYANATMLCFHAVSYFRNSFIESPATSGPVSAIRNLMTALN
jgi:membrane protein involved in colicin uptake